MSTSDNPAPSSLQSRLGAIVTEGVTSIYAQLLQISNPIFVVWLEYPHWEIGSRLVEVVEGDFAAVLKRWQAYYDHLIANKLHLSSQPPKISIEVAHPSAVAGEDRTYAVVMQKIEGGYDNGPEEMFNLKLGACCAGLDAVVQAKLCEEIVDLVFREPSRLLPPHTQFQPVGKGGNLSPDYQVQ